MLWITLVGAEDGIIHAQRGMTLSPAFTRELHDAIRTQAMRPVRLERLHRGDLEPLPAHLDTVDRLGIALAPDHGQRLIDQWRASGQWLVKTRIAFARRGPHRR